MEKNVSFHVAHKNRPPKRPVMEILLERGLSKIQFNNTAVQSILTQGRKKGTASKSGTVADSGGIPVEKFTQHRLQKVTAGIPDSIPSRSPVLNVFCLLYTSDAADE